MAFWSSVFALFATSALILVIGSAAPARGESVGLIHVVKKVVLDILGKVFGWCLENIIKKIQAWYEIWRGQGHEQEDGTLPADPTPISTEAAARRLFHQEITQVLKQEIIRSEERLEEKLQKRKKY